MNKIISKFAPQLLLIEDNVNGVSLTQASRIAQDYTNAVTQSETKIPKDSFSHDYTHTFLTTPPVIKEVLANKLDKEVLANCVKNSVSVGRIAYLRSAIKTLQNARKAIEGLTIFKFTDIEFKSEPIADNVTDCSIERALEMDNVEDFYAQLTQLGVSAVGLKNIQDAIILEGEVSHIGKLIHKDSVIHNVINMKTTPQFYERKSGDTLVLTDATFAYTPSEVAEFQEQYKKYQALYQEKQSRLNGYKKSMKDALRIAKSDADAKYAKEMQDFNNEKQKALADATKNKNQCMNELASFKIAVPFTLD